MNKVTATQIKSAFRGMAATMEENRDHLCELDGVIGDADHGIAMAGGFGAVRSAMETLPEDASPTDVFNTAAKSFLNAVGASSGPLYATAFMRAAASAKGKVELEAQDVVGAIRAMADGIAHRGKAQPGDKTMLDAWLPAAEAAENCRTDNISEILGATRDAAQKGAEGTRDLEARMGRAARLGARSKGHVDPGAASAALLIGALADHLN